MTAIRPESVTHPAHYTQHPSGVECIVITEHFNFCLGNVIKYVWRAGLKRPPAHAWLRRLGRLGQWMGRWLSRSAENASALEDLQKARWYLDREIARRQGGAG